MFNWAKISDDPGSKDAWRKYADWYNSISQFIYLPDLKSNHDQFMVDLLIKEAAGRPILDIGIADHTRYYVNRDKWFHRKLRAAAASDQVWGFDINAALIDYIRDKFSWNNLYAGDATRGPIKENFFGAIYAGFVLDQVSHTGEFLNSCYRALVPGGVLLISTDNPHSIEFLKRMRDYGTVPASFERICFVTPSCITQLAQRTGFEFETSYYLCGRKRARMAKLFGRLYFRYRDLIWDDQKWLLRKPVNSNAVA